MRAANAAHNNAVPTIFRQVAFICVFIAFIILFVLSCVMPPIDPIPQPRETRPPPYAAPSGVESL